MRIVYAEDAHTLIHPKAEHAFEGIPQSLPVGRLEIQRINILILLGRVLCILNRPIGALLEKFRMFGHPGMIRGALERNIEGNFHFQLPGALDQVGEVFQRTQGGMDRSVPTLGRADRPGAALISRGGFDGVVLALAKTFSDGRDGGQVENVKTHFRHIVHPAGYVAQRTVLSRRGRPGTGKELIPGGKTRPFPVDNNFQFALVPGLERGIGITMDHRQQFVLQCECDRGILAALASPIDRSFLAQAASLALSSLVARGCTCSRSRAPVANGTARSCCASTRFLRSLCQVSK